MTVVPVDEPWRAAELAAAGVPVVVAGPDAATVAVLVVSLRKRGAVAAAYVGAAGDPGAVEMARELFAAVPEAEP